MMQTRPLAVVVVEEEEEEGQESQGLATQDRWETQDLQNLQQVRLNKVLRKFMVCLCHK